MKKSTRSLDRAIDAVAVDAPQKRCRVCASPDLDRIVRRWVERRARGDVVPSLQAMLSGLFRRVADCSYMGVLRHCRDCLGVDHKTGRNP